MGTVDYSFLSNGSVILNAVKNIITIVCIGVVWRPHRPGLSAPQQAMRPLPDQPIKIASIRHVARRCCSRACRLPLPALSAWASGAHRNRCRPEWTDSRSRSVRAIRAQWALKVAACRGGRSKYSTAITPANPRPASPRSGDFATGDPAGSMSSLPGDRMRRTTSNTRIRRWPLLDRGAASRR
jgi:hypothetical protein